jgi:hypothetical protein
VRRALEPEGPELLDPVAKMELFSRGTDGKTVSLQSTGYSEIVKRPRLATYCARRQWL